MCIKKICLLICLAMHFPMSAQKLTVDGMKSTNDLSASQYRRKDLAGEACALVKVQLAITGHHLKVMSFSPWNTSLESIGCI